MAASCDVGGANDHLVVAVIPGYADYQRNTTRTILVVVLERLTPS